MKPVQLVAGGPSRRDDAPVVMLVHETFKFRVDASAELSGFVPTFTVDDPWIASIVSVSTGFVPTAGTQCLLEGRCYGRTVLRVQLGAHSDSIPISVLDSLKDIGFDYY